MALEFIIEGPGAPAAASALVDTSGVEGRWEELPTEGEKELITLAAIATIVGLVGGALEIAERLRAWHKEWSTRDSSTRVEKVVLIRPDGRRMSLEGLSTDELAKLLEDFR